MYGKTKTKKSGGKSQVKKPVGKPRGRNGDTSKNPKGRYGGGNSTVKVPC